MLSVGNLCHMMTVAGRRSTVRQTAPKKYSFSVRRFAKKTMSMIWSPTISIVLRSSRIFCLYSFLLDFLVTLLDESESEIEFGKSKDSFLFKNLTFEKRSLSYLNQVTFDLVRLGQVKGWMLQIVVTLSVNNKHPGDIWTKQLLMMHNPPSYLTIQFDVHEKIYCFQISYVIVFEL